MLPKNLKNKINKIHYSLIHSKLDSRTKLKQLIKDYSCNENEYIIAGSWAIEIISNTKLKHSDIDLIFISTPSLYIDDATIEEEKCYGKLPLSANYFQKTQIKRELFDEEIYVPSFDFQIAMKIIGELNNNFTERAQMQMKLLFNNYNDFDKDKSAEELKYIFKKTTPPTLDHNQIALDIINSILSWQNGEKEDSIKQIIKIHSTVNKKLREEFSRRGLDKKIKISEIDV